jgi:enamine deaminase RidA (YjgF/YER057c/UK114 family)
MRLALSLVMIALAATPAAGGVRQDATVIMPTQPEARKMLEDWGFSEAIVAGDTVYMSGVVVGLRPGDTDLAAAYARTFDRMGETLKRAGVTWDDVVDMTTYHTDLTTQLPALTPVKHRYIKAPFPAWTAIGVSRLVPDRGITEIKLVAKLPKAAARTSG